jgi:myo-inositol-1-phosphate synthase
VAGSIKVAIVGVGNCASALAQGIEHYRDAAPDDEPPGLMSVVLGGYHVRDIEIVAAFDVDRRKVGRDLADAMLAPPNNTLSFAQVPRRGVVVARGPTLDGLGVYLKDVVAEAPEAPVDVTRALRASGAQVMVIYLPVGAEVAAAWYAERALEAGCAVVNCIPVFLASDPRWAERFAARGLPIVGDDVKSQVGATILHRVLAHLLAERGVRLERTYQLNFGGNTDFLNMLERERLQSKKISKTRAVTAEIGHDLPADRVHVGPSDHVAWLADRKWCHIRLEATGFGGAPTSIDLKLEVWDSPNSAGVVVDAVRCVRLALDRGVGGPLEGPSAWLMKSPPRQHTDAAARRLAEAFVAATG